MVRWLFGNLRDVVPGPGAQVVLILSAILCGAIVGFERERRDKPAGMRTLALICLGSAVFTMVSVDHVLGAPDPGRVAAQVVTGVGFLGAGAILRGGQGVVGLTTAATIWVTAAIGLVVGSGYAGAGLGLSIVVPSTLFGFSRLEAWQHRRRPPDPGGGERRAPASP